MRTHDSQLDVLLVSEAAPWPCLQGGRLRMMQMALALAELGWKVGVSSLEPLPPDAPASVRQRFIAWPNAATQDRQQTQQAWQGLTHLLRVRVAEHQGMTSDRYAGVLTLLRAHQPRVVISLGQHGAMMLAGVPEGWPVRKIWYAADDMVWFHASCARLEPLRQVWPRVQQAMWSWGMERLFLPKLDGAIAVSPWDAQCLRWIGGAGRVCTIRNGVDTAYFSPGGKTPQPRSLVFWGRLDFEPNQQAIAWFGREVWPSLRQRWRDASWHIVGAKPGVEARTWQSWPGVQLHTDVADLRPYISPCAVAILPMRCGGGIKNKLLEAAALGMPMVASPLALRGLHWGEEGAPALCAHRSGAWLSTISRLWNDPASAQALGARARQWVLRHHTWSAAARQLVDWVGRFDPHWHQLATARLWGALAFNPSIPTSTRADHPGRTHDDSVKEAA